MDCRWVTSRKSQWYKARNPSTCKWISTYDINKLTEICLPHLKNNYPQVKNVKKEKLSHLIESIQSDLVTINDITQHLKFYFETPTLTKNDLLSVFKQDELETITAIVTKNMKSINEIEIFLNAIKKEIKEKKIHIKILFSFIRMVLMGQPKGPSINVLFSMLANEEIKNRLESALKII